MTGNEATDVQSFSHMKCIEAIYDLLSENPALCNIEFELEAILSVQVVSQLNSDYYTNVSQGAWTVSY